MAAGMNGYVAKPIKLRELLAAIASSIGQGGGTEASTATSAAAARAAEAATAALNQMLERSDRP
jgi:DNA-binding response OmpR family regulator